MKNIIYIFGKKSNFDYSTILKSIHDLKEEEIIVYSKKDILLFLDNYIKEVLFHCGMDEFIQKEMNFTPQKYRDLIKKYKELFENNSYNLNSVKENAYIYINNDISKFNIYTASYTNRNLVINGSIKEDVYSSILNISESENIKEFKYLNEFINYMELQNENDIKKIKRK